MHDKLSADGIYNEIFNTAPQILEKFFNADLSKQRMDSVHIQSNMQHLGRISLFVKTIQKFLRNLKRQHRVLFDQLDATLTRCFLSKKEESIFAMVKPADSSKTLEQQAKAIGLKLVLVEE